MCMKDVITWSISGEVGIPPLVRLLMMLWNTPFEMNVWIFEGRSLKTWVVSWMQPRTRGVIVASICALMFWSYCRGRVSCTFRMFIRISSCMTDDSRIFLE